MDATAHRCSPFPPAAADGTPLAFPDSWRTEAALGLAFGIRADQAFDRMPILADALEEAGCDDVRVLNHCRQCERHFPQCWVIAGVLPAYGSYEAKLEEDRLKEAVRAAIWQGHPDDPDVIPGRPMRLRPVEDEAAADARQEKRDRITTRVVWACVAVVLFFFLWVALPAVFR